MKLAVFQSLIVFLVFASAASAEEVTLQSAPAVVVKTVPQAGANDVDPELTEIRVTFSKEMSNGAWSWSQISDETFPKATGKPHYMADKRTCVLPVKLSPGKIYVIWLNPEKFPGFRDSSGHPAVFYPLVFRTKPAAAENAKPEGEYPVGVPDTVKKPPTFTEPLSK